MARRAHPLILVGLAVMAAACTRSGPMHVALQDTWSGAERAQIISLMERWEKATNHLIQFVPSPVPFHDHSDGFERSDLDDGTSVLYKIMRPTEDTEALESVTGNDLLGYNFRTDILIFKYKLYFVDLDAVVLHELGHHFGLGHNRIHSAVMNDLETGFITCITQWDLEAFCQLYGCDASDLHPECITTDDDLWTIR